MKGPQKGAGPASLSGIVKVVVNTFLEQKHFRQLLRTLSDQWSSCHSLTAAVRLMEAHGVRITPEEEKRLQQLPEAKMIDALVMKMPQQSREQFEHFFLQLSFIASTTTRLRTALEAGQPEAIEDALESAENVGVLPYIIKMAVAQAGHEVRTVESEHESWLADTEARMAPLLQSQANSMSTQKALAQAKAEVETYQSEAKEKSKSVLMGLTSNNDKTLLGMSVVAWHDHIRRTKKEAEIRKQYEEEIAEAQKKLMDYKAAQLSNVRNVLQRSAKESNSGLIVTAIGALKAEAEDIKRVRNAKAEMNVLEAKLQKFSAASAAAAQKVMGRMSAASEDGLVAMAFKAWMQFITDYKKDKVMNDAVKAAEKKVQDFLTKQNEGAKSVLQRINNASASGCINAAFTGWAEAVKDAKESTAMEEMLNAKSSKLNAFSTRNKTGARTASQRVAILQDQAYTSFCLTFWKREAKCERMRRYGKEKNLKRKQELIGVKGLFKNFASELETSLKEGTPRVEVNRGGGGQPA